MKKQIVAEIIHVKRIAKDLNHFTIYSKILEGPENLLGRRIQVNLTHEQVNELLGQLVEKKETTKETQDTD